VRNRAKPSRRSRSDRNDSKTGDQAEYRASKVHRDLAQFEDYQTILKTIRDDIKKGLTPKQLREKYAPLAQARVISDMLTSDDAGKALAAAKDVLDRIEGKATEKKEVSHRFADVSDKELDAILKSEEDDLEAMSERFEQ
jgi:hypothetical protein